MAEDRTADAYAVHVGAVTHLDVPIGPLRSVTVRVAFLDGEPPPRRRLRTPRVSPAARRRRDRGVRDGPCALLAVRGCALLMAASARAPLPRLFPPPAGKGASAAVDQACVVTGRRLTLAVTASASLSVARSVGARTGQAPARPPARALTAPRPQARGRGAMSGSGPRGARGRAGGPRAQPATRLRRGLRRQHRAARGAGRASRARAAGMTPCGDHVCSERLPTPPARNESGRPWHIAYKAGRPRSRAPWRRASHGMVITRRPCGCAATAQPGASAP